jgi:D-sedoheptulose 7-phosphate isomerase
MCESSSLGGGSVREQIAEIERVAAGIAAAEDEIARVSGVVYDHIAAGGMVITCGNGGSALEAQHFAAELISHFRRDRPSVPAISLPLDYGVITSIANDFTFEQIFSRQVEALAGPGDLVIGISTSGNSANVVAAMEAGRARGATTLAFSGRDPGAVGAAADYCLTVDSKDTARIQEGHLMIVHLICEDLDARLAG